MCLISYIFKFNDENNRLQKIKPWSFVMSAVALTLSANFKGNFFHPLITVVNSMDQDQA